MFRRYRRRRIPLREMRVKIEVTDNKDGTYAVKILGITITTNRKDLEGQVEKWISEVTKAATYEDDGTTVKTPAGKLSGYSIKKNSINEFAGTVNLTITSKQKVLPAMALLWRQRVRIRIRLVILTKLF